MSRYWRLFPLGYAEYRCHVVVATHPGAVPGRQHRRWAELAAGGEGRVVDVTAWPAARCRSAGLLCGGLEPHHRAGPGYPPGVGGCGPPARPLSCWRECARCWRVEGARREPAPSKGWLKNQLHHAFPATPPAPAARRLGGSGPCRRRAGASGAHGRRWPAARGVQRPATAAAAAAAARGRTCQLRGSHHRSVAGLLIRAPRPGSAWPTHLRVGDL